MGKRILLADDSITIQKVIELTFSDEDFEVVTVGNGRLAIEKIQEVRPDLVLCDIIMPEKDGYEVCDFVKKNAALSHVPVLLLTGAFEPFDQERAARVGCDGFLAKPFEPQALISKVKDLLSRAQSPEPAAAGEMAPPAPAPTPVEEPPAPAAPPPSRVAPFPQPAAPEPFFMDEPEPEAPAPPPPPVPPSPVAAPRLEEPEVQFIPEEPFPEPVEFAPVDDNRTAAREATVDFGSVSPFDDYEMASFEEVTPSPMPQVPEPLPVFEPIDAGMEELLPISAEEAETLAAPNDSPRPTPSQPAQPWTQPTVEVSLEERAQASVEAAQLSPEPFFEEVFEEEPVAPPRVEVPPPPPMVVEHVLLDKEDEPLPGLLDEEEPIPFQPIPAPATGVQAREKEEWTAPPIPVPASLAKEPIASPPPAPANVEPAPVAPREPEPLELADAGPVSAEVVSQVVTQISERIIREIAWEVIPDLAEALIKKEIERLKAELAQS